MSSRKIMFDRRRIVTGGAALLGASLLSGCDDVSEKPWARRILDKDEDANLYVQRLLLSDQKLAPEYPEAEISPQFKANGNDDPKDKAYRGMVKTGFATFKLAIDGLVERPQSWSLPDLRAMPARTQITRHDCVEGWSCIGKWTGVPLGDLLKAAGLKPAARFIVFHCADTMDEGGLDALSADDADTSGDDATPAGDQAPASTGQTKAPDAKIAKSAGGTGDASDVGSHYYESIDLVDAFHPQTILAYDMNGMALPVAHGAPLRLRLERQLGYKMAKYVMRIAVVDHLDGIGKGGGGYWEDQGYEWYAGI
ncbi:molybdopterin-dependent oxidoreductase [Lichenifustis flavocetrariae]|uniref:Molybdopterin-dependent oxidoreductase n=1 Tax=Lichenifustis flavocetrariae TaxID=2949735 RepID=A0AA41Z0E7_9HYPH|nr:molybdopterin-dependent oxidoreductase [Lichenifustis flavocetrariae]MCW6510468.1 molybdopterin-dependent oxidoreductase [Lichenifustis flavocetrariae]